MKYQIEWYFEWGRSEQVETLSEVGSLMDCKNVLDRNVL